ncbi:hypothetical protein [Pendulispora albinea]|uniref:Secreted protein n=1 Tax=Pendulispora albinea TaxID=2741071 RepID=A0ABZ2LU91_9BACT
MRKLRTIGSSTAAVLLAVLLSSFVGEPSAHADDTIKHPGDHPDYKLELEPHGLFAWEDFYGGTGFGAGGRFTIPVVHNGFVPSINNSIGISFGLDLVHYSGCYYRGAFGEVGCGANYLFFPVAMQWNFYVAERWSVAGEPGLFIYHGFFDDDYCGPGISCGRPDRTGLRPMFSVLGRYHFNEKISLTMRVGYPTFSIGASFFL